MRKGGSQVIYVIVGILLLLVMIYLLYLGATGQTARGGGSVDRLAGGSISFNSSIQCNTFCGQQIGKSQEDQKKAMCYMCKTGGSFTCYTDDVVDKKCDDRNSAICVANPEGSVSATCYDVLNNLVTVKSTPKEDTYPKTIVLKAGEPLAPIPGIIPNEKITVALSDTTSVDTIKLTLMYGKDDFTFKCGEAATLACFNGVDKNPFIVPIHPLPDGRYSVQITANNPPSTPVAEASVIFNWACPEIVFDSKTPFAAGKTINAIFESDIGKIGNVEGTLKKTGTTASGKSLSKSTTSTAANPNKIVSFSIPKLEEGTVEGDNDIIVRRTNEGLCIIDNDVKNEVKKTFNWQCPANGCLKSGSDWYQLTGESDTGSIVSSDTGCRYATKVERCKNGCVDGICSLPDLKIISVAIDGEAVGSQIYESAKDRLINVTVKNVGTSKAYDLYGETERVTAVFGEMPLELFAGDKNNLSIDEVSNYTFVLPASTPRVPLDKNSVPANLFVDAKSLDAEVGGVEADLNPADNSKSFDLTVYKVIFFDDFKDDLREWTAESWKIDSKAYGDAKSVSIPASNEDKRLDMKAEETLPISATHPKLSFWQYHDVMDSKTLVGTVQILVKSGTTFGDPIVLKRIYGTNSAGVWKHEVIDLSTYAGKTVKIGFLSTANSWYIDDVQLAVQ